MDRFIPYVGLIQDSVGRLTKAWDGRFHATPAGAVTVPAVTYRRDLVQVQRMIRVKGRLWLLIAAVPDEGWPVDGKSQDLGWIPAFDTRGVPTYWFYVDAC